MDGGRYRKSHPGWRRCSDWLPPRRDDRPPGEQDCPRPDTATRSEVERIGANAFDCSQAQGGDRRLGDGEPAWPVARQTARSLRGLAQAVAPSPSVPSQASSSLSVEAIRANGAQLADMPPQTLYCVRAWSLRTRRRADAAAHRMDDQIDDACAGGARVAPPRSAPSLDARGGSASLRSVAAGRDLRQHWVAPSGPWHAFEDEVGLALSCSASATPAQKRHSIRACAPVGGARCGDFCFGA